MRFHQLDLCQIKLTVMNIIIASVLSPSFLSPVHLLLYCMLFIHNEHAFTYSRLFAKWGDLTYAMQRLAHRLSHGHVAKYHAYSTANCCQLFPTLSWKDARHAHVRNFSKPAQIQILTVAINVILYERAQKDLIFIMINFNYFLKLLSKSASVYISINNITAARY